MVTEQDLQKGKMIWQNWLGSRQLGEIVSEGIVKSPCSDAAIVVIAVAEGRRQEVFLGDAGVPGHNYDERPCRLYKTEAELIADIPNQAAWLEKIMERNRGHIHYVHYVHWSQK